jgi:hypothetical protein
LRAPAELELILHRAQALNTRARETHREFGRVERPFNLGKVELGGHALQPSRVVRRKAERTAGSQADRDFERVGISKQEIWLEAA